MGKMVFITGGARSGKSSFALDAGGAAGTRREYVATAEALDDEMRERIERHRRERGEGWDTREEPVELADALLEAFSGADAVVVDCLTLWVSNLMRAGRDVEEETEKLLQALREARERTTVLLVSNEVGMGIVPANETARRFRDLAGTLNRRVAEAADEVHLVVAGIPLRIKP
jgi:adenosylcobinamide kinase/adenosylcobinamide-phosphate guanylyltransferase